MKDHPKPLMPAGDAGMPDSVRIAVQAEIYRIEALIEAEDRSQEYLRRLWGGFFKDMAKQAGSIAIVVCLLTDLGYDDQKILGLLRVSGFSSRQIDKILAEAGWSESRAIATDVQAMIDRIEVLIEEKTYSAERLWKEFFDVLAKKRGTIAEVVKLLGDLECHDSEIFSWLYSGANTDRQVAEILAEAGWSDGRMAGAVFMFEDVAAHDFSIRDKAALNVADFLLSSGLSHVRVIRALNEADCLFPKTIDMMLAEAKNDLDFFRVVVEAGCFNSCVYRRLQDIGCRGKFAWTDRQLVKFMSQMNIPDNGKITLFAGAGKALDKIWGIFVESGWERDRIIAAFAEAGYSPGIIVSSCVGYADDKIKSSADYSSTETAKYAKTQASIMEMKRTAVAILEKLTIGDRAIIEELWEQDWCNSQIVDYLIVGGWQPERIIRAMLESGATEYQLTGMINGLAEEFKSNANDYWHADSVKLWKDALRNIISPDQILKLIQG